ILGADFQAAAGEAIARLERLVAVCDAGEDDQLSLPRSSVERLAQQARRVRFDRDLPLEVGASTEPEILVRRPGVAISTGVEAPPVWVDAPAEADMGTVVVREDLARVVSVDLELRWRDLLQVLDLRREPRVGRIGDGSGNHGRRSMYLNLRSGKAPPPKTRCQSHRRLPQGAGNRRSDHAEQGDGAVGRRSDVGEGQDQRWQRDVP